MPEDKAAFYKRLVERYKNGQASEKEAQVFFHLLNKKKLDKYLTDALNEEAAAMQQVDISRRPGGLLKRMPVWIRISAAAAIVVIVAGTYFMINKSAKPNTIAVQNHLQPLINDVAPGGNKAVLTLTDGSAIILDSAKNGRLADQDAATILKVGDGQIAYDAIPKESSRVEYNTLTTPKGGQYMVTLPDGTKVWLDAVSSLRFPTAFTGNERNVELTGEAYFEVAKNASMPFRVKVNDMNVEVLGTHFNIMAYENETTVKTTLLEGAVKITKGHETALLKPGQQVQLNKNGQMKLVEDADVEEAVAWKNGFFNLNNADLQAIMRQIERWYDVDVVYEGELKPLNFGGIITRRSNASDVLKLMETTGVVKFSIAGKKITVRIR